MKMRNTKQIVMVAVVAIMAGLSVGAKEPPLELSGKTITIYPVLLRQVDEEKSAAQTWAYGFRLAENLGISLEQWGMLPHISAEEVPTGTVKESLIESVKPPDALPDNPVKTDYALFLLFEVKGTGAEKAPWIRAQAVMTDAQGQVVWSQAPGEFTPAGKIWPIALYHQIGEQILSVSDLQKPDMKPEPGPLETRARERHENSVRERKQPQGMEVEP